MRNISSIFIVLLMIGCDQIVDYQIPVEMPIPVVNALISPDSVFKINLTGSRHVLDNNNTFNPFLADQVLIFRNGDPIGEAKSDGKGNYILENYFPELGKTYGFEINTSGYPKVKGMDRIPDTYPEFLVSSYKTVQEEYSISHSFDLDINIPEEQTFFEVMVYAYEYIYDWQGSPPPILTDSIIRVQYIYSDDPIIDESSNNYFSRQSLLFSNELINQGNFRLTIHVEYLPFKNNYSGDKPEPVEVEIVLRSISESYYLYMRSFQIHRETIGDPLAEPVIVFNNIENGLGIFCTYLQFSRKIVVPYPYNY